MLANDTAASGGTLRLDSAGGRGRTVHEGRYGTWEIVGDTELIYRRTDDDAVGVETVAYTVTDSSGDQSSALIRLAIDQPLAATDHAWIDTGREPTLVDVTANDAPPAGYVLTDVTPIDPAAGVGASVTADGRVLLTTDRRSGVETEFEYMLADPTDPAARPITGRLHAVLLESATDTHAGYRPPSAADDVVVVPRDRLEFAIDVLANDIPGDGGGELRITRVTSNDGSNFFPGRYGTIAIVDGGHLTYRRHHRFGIPGGVIDTFRYTIVDDDGGTATGTLSVVLDEPGLVVDEVTMPVDGSPVILDPLGNDALTAGYRLDVADTDGPIRGSLTDDGRMLIESFGGAAARRGLEYTVRTSSGLWIGQGRVWVTTTAVGPDPAAVDDTLIVPAGEVTTSIDVLANDTALTDDGRLVVLGVSTVATGSRTMQETTGTYGRLSIDESGDLRYRRTAATGFGTDTFYYTVADTAGGGVSVGRLEVSTDGDVLVADNFNLPIAADEPIVVDPLANDRLPPGYRIDGVGRTTSSTYGNVAYSNGAYLTLDGDGTMTLSEYGTSSGSSPPAFRYRVVDADGNHFQGGTISVTRLPFDAVADRVTLPAGVVDLDIDVSANDPDAAKLSIVGVSRDSSNAPSAAAGGWVGRLDFDGGRIRYRRTSSDRHGGDSFWVHFTDNAGNTGSTPLRIDVPVPLLRDDDVAVITGPMPTIVDVLANDHLPVGYELFGVCPPGHTGFVPSAGLDGPIAVAVRPDGRLDVTMISDEPVSQRIEYAIRPIDPNDDRPMFTATMTVRTGYPGRPVVAVDDTFVAGPIGLSFELDVLANDDAGDVGESLTVIGVHRFSYNPPEDSVDGGYGRLEVDAAGTVRYVRTSQTGTGTDSLYYTVQDAAGHRDVGRIQVRINEALVRNDAVTFPAGVDRVFVDPLFNDAYPAGVTVVGVAPASDPSTVDVVAAGSLLRAEVFSDGRVAIENPDGHRVGTESFVYAVADADGSILPGGRITATIAPRGPAPRTVDDVHVLAPSATTLTIDPLANDWDERPDELKVRGIGTYLTSTNGTAAGRYGRLTLDPATDTLTYRRTSNDGGTDSFRYSVVDDTGQTATAVVTVVVSPVTVADDVVTVTFDGDAVTFDPTANDDVVVGERVIALSTSRTNALTTQGTSVANDSYRLEITDDSRVVATHAGGPVGDGTAYYRTDGGFVGAIDIDVVPSGTAPAGVPDVVDLSDWPQTSASQFIIDVLANDVRGSTPGGIELIGVRAGSASATAVPYPSAYGDHGTLRLQDGRLTYTRRDAAAGSDVFTYWATDAGGHTYRSEVTIELDDDLFVRDNVTVSFDDPIAVFDPLANDRWPERFRVVGVGTTDRIYTQPSTSAGLFDIDVSILPDGRIEVVDTETWADPRAATFYYFVADDVGVITVGGTFRVNVSPIGSPVAAADDVFTIDAPGWEHVVDPLGNDDPGDPDERFWITRWQNGHGSNFGSRGLYGELERNPDNTYTYRRTDPRGFGTDRFTYTVRDDGGNTDTATLDVVVTSPLIVDDAITVPHGFATATLDPVANDALPGFITAGLAPLGSRYGHQYSSTIENESVRLTVGGDGRVTVDELDGPAGTWTFNYHVCNPDGVFFEGGQLTVTLLASSSAADDMFTIDGSTDVYPLAVLDNDDTGPAGGTLDVTAVSATPIDDGVRSATDDTRSPSTAVDVGPGRILLRDGGLIFVWTAAAGVDAVTFDYRTTDIRGDSTWATVTLDVSALAVTPIAVDVPFTTPSVDLPPPVGAVPGSAPAGGDWRVTGVGPDSAATLTVIAATADTAAGTFVVDDGRWRFDNAGSTAGTWTTTVTAETPAGVIVRDIPVTVRINPVGSPVQPVDDRFRVYADQTSMLDVLANDAPGSAGSAMTLVSVDVLRDGVWWDDGVANFGTVTIDATGRHLVYVRDAAFESGTETLRYTVRDAGGHTSRGSVVIDAVPYPESLDRPPNNVTGRVFLDVDGDGRYDAPGDRPATPGVLSSGEDVEVRAIAANGATIATAVPDAGGVYRLDWDADVTVVRIEVRPPSGYAPTLTNVGVDRTIDSDVDSLTGSTRFLTAGENRIDIGLAADADSDGIADVVANYWSFTPDADRPATRDAENDGLSDFAEVARFGTRWDHADTDGDITRDGYEIFRGGRPLRPRHAPEDAPEDAADDPFRYADTVDRVLAAWN